MPDRTLVLISSYRIPTHHALMLGSEDTNAWWSAWRRLWDPALLRDATALPVVAEAYEHTPPKPGAVYAVPESPPPYLPEDWDAQLRAAGAERVDAEPPADTEPARWCAALGLGYAVIDALHEAMDHARTLDTGAFLAELKAAAAGDEAMARAAAERLLAARDVVYPATIHLIDLSLGRPMTDRGDLPYAVVGTAADFLRLDAADRDRLRADLDAGVAELCGGLALDRPDAELPVESQLWSFRRGRDRTREALGQAPAVFARPSAGMHPYLPNWLAQVDVSKILFLTFDGSALPHRAAAAIRWPAPDGRTIDALTRGPHPADDPQTGFHLAHYLHQTVMQDSAAILLFRHGAGPAAPWHRDLITLTRLAPALGTFTTPGRYLDEGHFGEYAPASAADDFPSETLDARVAAATPDPVSAFARHARLRRRLDATHTYWALRQSLGTPADAEQLRLLDDIEDELEGNVGAEPAGLPEAEDAAARALAERLTARSAGGPGWLLLNPCPFPRRIGLDRTDLPTPPVDGPVKAAQRDGDRVRLVVEIPGLGYAWIPDIAAAPAAAARPLADGHLLRNEFFEAEIDPVTGGLKSFADGRDRIARLSQHLAFVPGGTMCAREVVVTAAGAALGEITARGQLVDDHGGVLAEYVQRYRAWTGRPLLELHIELTPARPPAGGPWHACYVARFQPRDDRAQLTRGVFGYADASTLHRPGSPDFLEFRGGKRSVLILTGGLPFAQRHGPHALDLVLVAPGETATRFDLALGLDRAQPAQSAQGFVSPVAVVRREHGPPAVGPAGWLAHMDSSAGLLTGLRADPTGKAVVARLHEVTGLGSAVTFRWARDPAAAAVVDGQGFTQMDATLDGDAATFDLTAHELVNLRVEWA